MRSLSWFYYLLAFLFFVVATVSCSSDKLMGSASSPVGAQITGTSGGSPGSDPGGGDPSGGDGDSPSISCPVGTKLHNICSAMVLLDPKMSGALSVTGSSQINVNTSIVINSNSAQAGMVSGSASVSTSDEFDIVGSLVKSGSASFSGKVHSMANPWPDPLQTLPLPDLTTMAVQRSSLLTLNSGSYDLKPGLYQGGIAISGSATVTFEAGNYAVQGPMTITGSGSVTGQGIFIYLVPTSASDQFSVSGSANINLSAATSGVYQGILLAQDRTSANPISITGSADLDIAGAIYAAAAHLSVSGSGNLGTVPQFIGNSLDLSGSGKITLDLKGGNVPKGCEPTSSSGGDDDGSKSGGDDGGKS